MKLPFIALVRTCAGLLIAATLALPAAAFDTRAKSAFVLDASTGTVLLEKNAHEPLPPASMSKLMTLYMLFEAIEQGRVGLQETFSVSSKAKAMGGSTMFLNELDRPTSEELIQGIIVSSGNDATVVVAEGLAGTEAAFARQMTERAIDLGMTESVFANASGWPHPQHRMSMADLAILALRLVEDFPTFYTYFAQEEYDYENRSPANRFNRNPILGIGIGADGLKTGHTQEAGYGLVGSAVQDGRRVIFAISGLDTAQARAEEAQAIVNWSFRQFIERNIATAGQRLAQADVWMGAQPTVGLVAIDDVVTLVPATETGDIAAEIVYTGPVQAPLTAGDKIAELVFTPEDMNEVRVPLVAETDVPRGGFVVRVATAAQILLRQFVQGAENAM